MIHLPKYPSPSAQRAEHCSPVTAQEQTRPLWDRGTGNTLASWCLWCALRVATSRMVPMAGARHSSLTITIIFFLESEETLGGHGCFRILQTVVLSQCPGRRQMHIFLPISWESGPSCVWSTFQTWNPGSGGEHILPRYNHTIYDDITLSASTVFGPKPKTRLYNHPLSLLIHSRRAF